MSKLIIEIDQKSGAILGVKQETDGSVSDLVGTNMYSGFPDQVMSIRQHRDTFDRIISVPLELWEKKGNTICSIAIGGVVYKCRH